MVPKWPSPSHLSRLHMWTQRGLDLLFPPACVGCHRPGHPLCPACAQSVIPVNAPICARCGRPQTHPVERCQLCSTEDNSPLQLTRAAGLYCGPLQAAIRGLKYEGRTELAAPLARYLCAIFAHPPWRALHGRIDAVIPAPLHAERQADRGYNQATLLAAHFCRQTGQHLQTDWVIRAQQTRPQVGLNAQERRVNVATAFVAAPMVEGRNLLLIDDVYTTGATMMACAAAAVKAGAHAVYGMALALPTNRDGPITS